MNFLLALLLTANVHAAKLVSQKALQYLPTFGIGSTGSVAYTTAAGATFKWYSAGGAPTTLLRVITTGGAYIAQGAEPTATASDMYLPANTEFVMEVISGYKISAFPASGPGRLIVTELIPFSQYD